MVVGGLDDKLTGAGGIPTGGILGGDSPAPAGTRMFPVGVRAVVLDKDGVLVNTEPEHERRLRTYLGERGIDCSEMPCLYGSNNEAIWSWVEPRDLARRGCLYQGFQKRWREEPMPYDRLLDPDVPSLLLTLRAAGLRLGLASSSPVWVIEDFLHASRLEGLFDAVLSGEQCVATKPAPDVYLRVMRELGVAPGETVAVEDSPTGILAAHRSGAFTCAVPLPEGVALDQSLADVRLSSLGSLADLIGL